MNLLKVDKKSEREGGPSERTIGMGRRFCVWEKREKGTVDRIECQRKQQPVAGSDPKSEYLPFWTQKVRVLGIVPRIPYYS